MQPRSHACSHALPVAPSAAAYMPCDGWLPALQSESQVRADVTRRIKKLGREGKPREAVAELANMAKLGIQVGRPHSHPHAHMPCLPMHVRV